MIHKKNIDELITQSLKKDEAKFYEALDELSIQEAFNSLFKGKGRKLSILLLVFSIILFITTIFSLIKFLGAETIEYMIKWGVATLASFFVLAFLDFYYFIQMNRNMTLREIKKLELKISVLTDKITNC